MTIHLTPHGEELLEAALARGVGHSAEEVVERALEASTAAQTASANPAEDRRPRAAAGRLALREKHHRQSRAWPTNQGLDPRGPQVWSGPFVVDGAGRLSRRRMARSILAALSDQV